jgi:hypothetical protein
MSHCIRIRRVMRTFEVRQVTPDNAVELALWLRDSAAQFSPPPRETDHPLVSYVGSKPALVSPSVALMGSVETVPAGSYIGWGWPTLIHDGDMVSPKLLVIEPRAIETQTDDQGIEVVDR